MAKGLLKAYDHREIQETITRRWLEAGAFEA